MTCISLLPKVHLCLNPRDHSYSPDLPGKQPAPRNHGCLCGTHHPQSRVPLVYSRPDFRLHQEDLQVAHDALDARGDPGKRRTFCLFISNFGGAMGIPTDPPYCLVYPTCYVRDADPDHFDTHNNLAGTHLHCCICCATLQFSNDEPREHNNYSGSLILPHGASTMNGCSHLSSSHGTTMACLLILQWGSPT